MIASPSSGNSPRGDKPSAQVVRLEDEKKYQHVLRRIFQEPHRLTEGAQAVCRDLHINAEEMYDKSMEDFEKELQKDNKKVPKEIVELRYNHYQTKRKKNFETIALELGVMHVKNKSGFTGGAITTQRWKPYTPKESLNNFHGTNAHHSRVISHANMNHTQALPLIGAGGKQYPPPPTYLNINLGGLNNSNDQETESNRSFNVGVKRVGKAAFGILSPSSSVAPTMKQSFRTALSSPDNVSKVTHSLMQLQSRIVNQVNRVERFKQVKQNAMQQAEIELQKIHQRIAKEQKKQTTVRKHIEEEREVFDHRKEKYTAKREHVMLNFQHNQKALLQKSVNGFQLNIKEVEQMSKTKRDKDREHSARQYEYLKHKIEDEEGSMKKRNEQKRLEEVQVISNLTSYEQKLIRGQSNAQMRLRETSSRASRTSSHLEEARRLSQSQWETTHTQSLKEVLSKSSAIDARRKKANESWVKKSEHIKERLNVKFERNHSARSHVEDELHRKGKMTLDRIKQKERLREIILERQQVELMKNKELNTLRRIDHQEQVVKEQAMLQSFKERVARKYILQDSARRDVKENLKMFQQQSPVNSIKLNFEERDMAITMKPSQILAKERLNLTLQLSNQLSPRMQKAQKAKMGAQGGQEGLNN